MENPDSGTITKVQSEIDDLKQIMVKNIGKLGNNLHSSKILVFSYL